MGGVVHQDVYATERPDRFAHQFTAVLWIGDVARLGLCTYPPDNGFFSYRRTTHRGEPDYGRHVNAIALA